jgi:hypothetical protein
MPAMPRGRRFDVVAGSTDEAGQVAKRVSRALPGWNIVMMPTISYGSSGANQMNGFPIHPGGSTE